MGVFIIYIKAIPPPKPKMDVDIPKARKSHFLGESGFMPTPLSFESLEINFNRKQAIKEELK